LTGESVTNRVPRADSITGLVRRRQTCAPSAHGGQLRTGRGPAAVAERDRNAGPPSSLSASIYAPRHDRYRRHGSTDYLFGLSIRSCFR